MNALLEQWAKTGTMLKDVLEQHTEQLADRKQADFDHNIQLGQLTNEVGSLRRELRALADDQSKRWGALFDRLGIEDPAKGPAHV